MAILEVGARARSLALGVNDLTEQRVQQATQTPPTPAAPTVTAAANLLEVSHTLTEATQSITGEDADDLLDLVSHGYEDGDRVRFTAKTGGSNLSTFTDYFVVNATANTFQVSDNPGGTALSFGSNITAATIGRTLPRAVAHLLVHVGTASGFTPSQTTLKGYLSGSATDQKLGLNSVLRVGIEDSADRYVKVVAVDINGKESVASAQAGPYNVSGAGDIYGNWNGDVPADLSSTYDGTATTGYYLDSSAGAAQFQGDLWVGGSMVLVGSGEIASNPSLAQEPDWFQGIYFDGTTSGRYITTPDTATNSVTGDFDFALLVRPDDLTPASNQMWGGKWDQNGVNKRQYMLQIETGGTIRLLWSTAGTGHAGLNSSTATLASAGYSDGSLLWIRGSLDVDNGSGGHKIRYWTAPINNSDPDTFDPKPGTWTQLGSDVTIATPTTSVYDGDTTLWIGGRDLSVNEIPTGYAYGLLLNNAFATADLWTDADVKFMPCQTNPTTGAGWPITQLSTGADDSPAPGPFTWTLQGGAQFTKQSLLVPEVGFSIDGATGRESFNTMLAVAFEETSAIAVTASYATAISKTVKLPFTGEGIIVKVYHVAYATDLGENETLFIKPKVVVGSVTYQGLEISDSNPNATGGLGTLDISGSNLDLTGNTGTYGGSPTHSHTVGTLDVLTSHGTGDHSPTGAPSVTLADKRVNLTSIPFVPGGGAIYVSGDEIVVTLETKGTNYTGKPRFGLLVEVFRAQS